MFPGIWWKETQSKDMRRLHGVEELQGNVLLGEIIYVPMKHFGIEMFNIPRESTFAFYTSENDHFPL